MKLPQVSSHTLIKKFKRIGYQDAPFQGKGSHVALYKDADGWETPGHHSETYITDSNNYQMISSGIIRFSGVFSKSLSYDTRINSLLLEIAY